MPCERFRCPSCGLTYPSYYISATRACEDCYVPVGPDPDPETVAAAIRAQRRVDELEYELITRTGMTDREHLVLVEAYFTDLDRAELLARHGVGDAGLRKRIQRAMAKVRAEGMRVRKPNKKRDALRRATFSPDHIGDLVKSPGGLWRNVRKARHPAPHGDDDE